MARITKIAPTRSPTRSVSLGPQSAIEGFGESWGKEEDRAALTRRYGEEVRVLKQLGIVPGEERK